MGAIGNAGGRRKHGVKNIGPKKTQKTWISHSTGKPRQGPQPSPPDASAGVQRLARRSPSSTEASTGCSNGISTRQQRLERT